MAEPISIIAAVIGGVATVSSLVTSLTRYLIRKRVSEKDLQDITISYVNEDGEKVEIKLNSLDSNEKIKAFLQLKEELNRKEGLDASN